MPIDLIEHKAWMDQTAVFGRIRSSELKELDDALAAYGARKTDDGLKKVRRTFEAWKLKEGVGWRNSPRNRYRTFDKLEDLLNPRGETAYDRDLATSRQGLLYLFAKTHIEIGLVETGKILIEGASDLVGGISGLQNSPISSQAASITSKASKGAVLALTGASKIQDWRQGKQDAAEVAKHGIPGGQLPPPQFGPDPKPPEQQAWYRKVWEMFKSFVVKIWEWLKGKAKDFWMEPGWEKGVDIWNLLSKVATGIVGKVAANAVPFVSAGVNIINGIGSTVKGCYERYQAYTLGKNVELNAGHPGVIADSIKSSMNMMIGKGLYATFRGVGEVVAAAFTGGASAIIMLVVTGCEILAKLVQRIWEIVGMRSFFHTARDRYAKGDAGYKDVNDFTLWYRKAATYLPCLSALAINSGITGDKMMYLMMFKDRGQREVIGQAEFNQGVEYLELLKDWSHDYLTQAGYDFTSPDAFVTTLLANTLKSKKPILTNISLKPATP
jgi:hypothetical protein